ncbi:hypothetical protein [Pseudemcibacter aquimaris]|uniref:hypothetical protein n=1 Tax=Pseudemcibacter aquimaris TaxID=2857064 RepID=UPI0020111413|nr:hypothetical protein [Pseudemcibacter aquimaris]MCC3861641.1 hypothetical protein [Pseudemcibacter aquimaris]WDU58412.1 hypothetical protein KW060_14560 [Pseudemcibacter aquimaris]
MLDEDNKILSPKDVLIKAYSNLKDNLKSYCILSYVVMLPLSLLQFIAPLRINPETTSFTEVLLPLLLTLAFLVIFSILLYRQFLMGKDSVFKLPFASFAEKFIKSFAYTIALSLVLILALLSVGLLFGLILVIVNAAAGENATDNIVISTVIWMLMSLFMALVIFRTIPTFANLAVSNTLLPMKSSYYYTRQNNKNLILIAIGCYAPMAMISALLFYIIYSLGLESDVSTMVISYILMPISLAPFALQVSAGSVLFAELVPDEYKS